MEFDAWYLENLVCPRDRARLSLLEGRLVCGSGHHYSVVDGVPVMLVEEAAETLDVISASLAVARGSYAKYVPSGNLYLETIGISNEERMGIIRSDGANESNIDPVVNYLVAASNGIMYRHLLGRLPAYPIPELPLSKGEGQHLLDIGCSWGRWCFAAARKGYTPVGLDSSLGAVMAARRVAAQIGVQARFVVGDARRLPFRDKAFPTIFSYSVVQHFSYDDARQTIREIARVLCPKGTSLIQLPNAFGLRSFYNQARRRFREPVAFEVRYWTPHQLRNTFESLIGETRLSVDCYFGIGLQAADISMMPFVKRNLIRASELGKKLSVRLGFLTALSDSIWTKSIRTEQ
jgi:SAM-dependent methyltransferase/uncharacterized protein YbaR (Trm112 family)